MERLSARDSLLSVGTCCALSTLYFYRARRTIPFKVSHILTWPTLGTALMLSVMPSDDAFKQALQKSGLLTREELDARQQANTAALGVLRHAADLKRP